MEEWRNIKGYEDIYQVSNLGRVISLGNGNSNHSMPFHILNSSNRGGYLMLHLWKDGKRKRMSIHRLVAEAFLENENKKDTVNHINGDKLDNRIENLEWATYSENIKHAYRVRLNASKNKKCIIQKLMSGEFVKKWDSLKEAARSLNACPANIRLCCQNKANSAYGYKWNYF
ncbi:MAG: HNH endonuclease [Candidatus Symbiothrix sp.]|jgi:hypothetical protein|nr:HNH endonuclease [Candidatus Symbiothrix sp.]